MAGLGATRLRGAVYSGQGQGSMFRVGIAKMKHNLTSEPLQVR